MVAGKQERFEAVVEALVNYEMEGKEIELMKVAEVTAELCKFKKIRLTQSEFALCVNRIFLKAKNFDFVKAEKAQEAAIVTTSKPLAVRKIQKVKTVKAPKKAAKAEKK